jgi:ribosomal protein L37E
MALIICSECGHQFSDKANSCPSCGCPTDQATNPDLAAEQRARVLSGPKKKQVDAKPGCMLLGLSIILLLSLLGAFVSLFEPNEINECNKGVASSCVSLLKKPYLVNESFDTSQITNKTFKPQFEEKVSAEESKAKAKAKKDALREINGNLLVDCQDRLQKALTDPNSLKIHDRDFDQLLIEYSATNSFGGRIRNVMDCKTGKNLR